MDSTAPRAEHIRLIIARFKECAEESTAADFRELMLNTVVDLETIAAELEAGESTDLAAERAA